MLNTTKKEEMRKTISTGRERIKILKQRMRRATERGTVNGKTKKKNISRVNPTKKKEKDEQEGKSLSQQIRKKQKAREERQEIISALQKQNDKNCRTTQERKRSRCLERERWGPLLRYIVEIFFSSSLLQRPFFSAGFRI